MSEQRLRKRAARSGIMSRSEHVLYWHCDPVKRQANITRRTTVFLRWARVLRQNGRSGACFDEKSRLRMKRPVAMLVR